MTIAISSFFVSLSLTLMFGLGPISFAQTQPPPSAADEQNGPDPTSQAAPTTPAPDTTTTPAAPPLNNAPPATTTPAEAPRVTPPVDKSISEAKAAASERIKEDANKLATDLKSKSISVDKDNSTSKGRRKRWRRVYAVLETTLGNVKIRLYHRRTPKTVANFIGLAEGTKSYRDINTRKMVTGFFYDGLTFHRIIPNYMVQTGDPLGNGRGGPGYKFDDEPHTFLKHNKPGMVSMANSGPNTNGSQFFIILKPIPELDFGSPKNVMNRKGNTVFGEVVEGLDIVKKIANSPRDPFDKPLEDIILNRVVIVRD